MDDYPEHISLIHSTRRLSQRLDSLLAELSRREPALHSCLAAIGTSSQKLAIVKATLIESLKDGSESVRKNAAWALGDLADWGSVTRKKLGGLDSLTAISDAFQIEGVVAVKVAMVEAISKFKTRHLAKVAELLLGSLDVPDPSVVSASVNCLAALGLTAVPDLVSKLISLLQSTHAEVRVSTCRALGGLGSDAFRALESLLPLVVGPTESKGKPKQGGGDQASKTLSDQDLQDTPLQRAAIEAVVQIDSTGEYLVYEVQDANLRDRVLNLLRQINASSSATYQRLHAVWIEAIQKGPPVGHHRMQKAEILSYILAQEDEDRNLDNWIKHRKPRAVRVWQGTYDVRNDDLENLRKLNLSRSTGLNQPTEESDQS